MVSAYTPADARIWDVSNESGLDTALRGLGAGDEIVFDQGTVLADVLDDFDGDIRPFSPDLGADEFTLIGDMNVDYRVDFDDIPAFTLGLNDADQYVAQYHVPPVERGDTNGNGLFDFDDIAGFVAILSGTPIPLVTHPVPEPSSWLLALVACLMLQVSRRYHDCPA